MSKTKRTRLTALMVSAVLIVTCIALVLVACNSYGQTTHTGTYYEYDGDDKNPNSYIELKSGGKWTDGDDSGTYTVKDGKISIMIEGEELMSGTVSNGVMILDFWGMKTTYKKDGATGSNGGTQGSQTVDNDAKVTAITGGTVDGLVVSLEVGTTTTAVDLSGMISVSKNSSWQLYEDITGQILIPTKYAANLLDGANTYYIVVNSSDDKVNRTYTLNIWKNFYTDVYFYANGVLFDTLENVSSHTYLEDFHAPRVDGYTFKGWDCEGYYVESKHIRFDAKLQANDYIVTLNANGGTCSQSSKSVTYDEIYTLPIPTREGYTFNGWKSGGDFITTSGGGSLGLWKTANDTTVTAQWTINQYDITVQADSSNGGTVRDAGTNTYDYGTSHMVTAETNYGYVFIGWYNGYTKVSDSLTYTYTTPASNTTYTAKWIKAPKLECNYSSAGYIDGTSGKYTLGQSITITAYSNAGNNGKFYVWLGWYDGDIKISADNSMTCKITILDKTKTYTAKWAQIQVSAFAGNVTTPSGTYNVGDEVELRSTPYLGCNFIGWYKNGTKVSDENVYVISAPAEDTSYQARYVAYTVTTNTNMAGAGTYTHADGQRVLIGQSFTLTASTNSGYTWLGWFDGDTKVSDSTSYTFTMTAESKTYTAKWTYYTVTTNTNMQEAGTYTQSQKVSTDDTCTLTATTNIGYTWLGWFDSDTKVSNDTEYSFTMIAENKILTAKWKILDSMTIYDFYSTHDSCTITGIKDKSVASLVVPDFVTNIIGGAFSGCSELTEITIPFTGGSRKTSRDTYQYPFGYIFGTSSYTGGRATTQHYYGSSTSSVTSTTYYIPTSLKKVTITDDSHILSGAFHNCSNLTHVIISNSVTSIGSFAFDGCSGLTNITIPDSVDSILTQAFRDCSGLTSITIPSRVYTIDYNTFGGCSGLTSIIISSGTMYINWLNFYTSDKLKYVYYKGTAEDWAKVSIGEYNDPLVNATCYYYSENEPTTDGNYWHYVDGVPTVWAKEN